MSERPRCKLGHPVTPENSVYTVTATGKRRRWCRPCRDARGVRSLARRPKPGGLSARPVRGRALATGPETVREAVLPSLRAMAAAVVLQAIRDYVTPPDVEPDDDPDADPDPAASAARFLFDAEGPWAMARRVWLRAAGFEPAVVEANLARVHAIKAAGRQVSLATCEVLFQARRER